MYLDLAWRSYGECKSENYLSGDKSTQSKDISGVRPSQNGEKFNWWRFRLKIRFNYLSTECPSLSSFLSTCISSFLWMISYTVRLFFKTENTIKTRKSSWLQHFFLQNLLNFEIWVRFQNIRNHLPKYLKTIIMKEFNHPNLVLINRFFEAYSLRSISVIKEVLHSQVKWNVPGRHPLSGTKSGMEEIIEYMDQLAEFNFMSEGIVLGFSDDHIIDCHRIWNNQGKNPTINTMLCILWKIQDGKIREIFSFPQDQYEIDHFFNSQLES